MKPSYDDERVNPSTTDRKFRQDDQHLLARDKEDVALSPHGDKLHTTEGPDSNTPSKDKKRKATP